MAKAKDGAKRGRPRKINSPADMERLTDEYVKARKDDGKPITLTGMLLHMGIHSRSTLAEYEDRDGFSEPVKRLRALVESAYEERLHSASPTGAIFALKNMGWSDKQEHELTGPDGGPLTPIINVTIGVPGSSSPPETG